ncbi:MAG: M23 family metallopeptidase [Gemmatimonadaceae bacterium]|nr:M23 family metallopeptidase [Gemmatimonadaceae bacterium]
MPGKRINFIVIPQNDGRVREFGLSIRLLWGGGIALCLLSGLFGYYALQFHTRPDPGTDLAGLRGESVLLEARLDSARRDLGRLEAVVGKLARQEGLEDPAVGSVGAGDQAPGVGGRRHPDDRPHYSTARPAEERIENLSQRIQNLQREALYQLTSSQSLIETFEANKENLLYVPTIWPVADVRNVWISSGFGDREDPFTGLKSKHLGIDLAGPRGLPIVATAAGEVAYAYADRFLGKVVVVNHDPLAIGEDGKTTSRPGLLRTEYGHLHKILVRKGQRVARGDTLGTMGSTGRSTGPHLHYAVRYQVRSRGGLNGYRDPQDFLVDWRPSDRPTGSIALHPD